MSFLRLRGAQACLVVALVALCTCDAFVPRPKSSLAFQKSVAPQLQTHEVLTCPPRVKRTQMSMILDQFISGRDEATRKKDTEQYLQQIQKRVDRINALESTIEDLDDEQLQAKSKEFKARLAKGEDINGPILEEAFAVVREAAWYVCQPCVSVVIF